MDLTGARLANSLKVALVNLGCMPAFLKCRGVLSIKEQQWRMCLSNSVWHSMHASA